MPRGKRIDLGKRKTGKRKFGKHIFFLVASTTSKKVAKKKAKNFRKHYKIARVVPDKKGNYDVYTAPIPAKR